MTANIAKFFRSTPCDSLKKYFTEYPSPISDAVNWNNLPKNIAKPLLVAVDTLNEEKLSLLRHDAERMTAMTDEIGQAALLSVILDADLETYQNLENEHDRSLFVFLRDQGAFRRAEEISYADHYRKGRMWDGFKGPSNILISCDPLDVEMFKQKIIDYFRTDGRIKVEIFQRTKAYKDDQELQLVQIMLYREGLPESYTALDDENDVVSKTYRPAYELALTYEPESGHIEVIANKKECREAVAKAFSETLLKTEIEGERVPLKQYDISKLMKPFDFVTDPEDGIASVKVMMLKLKPYNNDNKVMLEVTASESRSIYDVSKEWFDLNDPLGGHFLLAQVKFVIQFKPDTESHRGKAIPVKISYPNRCDLKSKTEKERLIADKYLKRWELLREI